MNTGQQPDERFIHHVGEADVDWILCIELNSNPSFREWIANEIFEVSVSHEGAWRSIANSFGESDLVWKVQLPDGHHALALIENKIDAVAQPDQHERYVTRGNDYVGKEVCKEFKTVLVAPSCYTSRDSASYWKRLSYESVQQWFQSHEDERSMFIVALLGAAIHKANSTAQPDPGITEFRMRFWELANSEFPSLGLKKPGELREYWVWHDYDGFTICYKSYSKFAMGGFYKSVVDLHLRDRAGQIEQFREAFGNELAAFSAEVVVTGKSIAFRLETLCAHPPEFDSKIARDALEKWNTLHGWWSARSKRADACKLLEIKSAAYGTFSE
jgi:hypothetical protein